MSAKKPELAQFGRNVQRFREARGFTQEGLAALLRCTLSTVVRIEAGRNEPRMKRKEKIAEILCRPLPDFFKEDPDDVAVPPAPHFAVYVLRADTPPEAAHRLQRMADDLNRDLGKAKH